MLAVDAFMVWLKTSWLKEPELPEPEQAAATPIKSPTSSQALNQRGWFFEVSYGLFQSKALSLQAKEGIVRHVYH